MPATKQKSHNLLASSLAKTRAAIMRALGHGTDSETVSRELLETALLCADCGVETTKYLLQEVYSPANRNEGVSDISALQLAIQRLLEPVAVEFVPSGALCIILLVGTNGSGKTTTAAKLGSRYSALGHSVILAAADTFRAAAIDQLRLWAERCQIPIVAKAPGTNPASVCYEAVQQAQQQKMDLLIVDSAGRQQNNEPMLQELQKIHKVLGNASAPGTTIESWMVLDAATGQNCLLQARRFSDMAKLTGLVINKLDGSAKGGVLLPMARELELPVRFLGTGEALDDMETLDAATFAKGLLAAV